MNPQEFAEKIRAKYPGVYDAIPDEELARKVVDKYPVYASQVNFDSEEIESTEPSIRQRLQKVVSDTGERIAEGPSGAGRVAELLRSPLRVGGEAVRATGEALAKPIMKAGEKLSETPFIKEAAASPELSGFEDVAYKAIGGIQEFLDTAKDKLGPEVYQSLVDSVELITAATGGRGAKAGLDIAGQAAKESALAGKEAVAGAISGAKEAVGMLPTKIKEKISGVKPKSGVEKQIQDSVEIAREPITPDYEASAARDGRTYTEGRTKEVKYKPTRREELLGDALLPLVEQGRISAEKLPFENIPEIQLEVNRINQGVRGMIADQKVPFNEAQLRSKLNAVKKDSDIIFTTDRTLERTYDALVDAFVKEMSGKDTLGLFEARQAFDKLPAVKNYLDGLKGASGENLRRQAVLDIRRAANEYISELLPTNNPYKPLLKKESYLIEAMGNLAEKSKGLGGTTNVSRYLDANPTLRYIIRQAIPFGAGATIF